MFNSNENNPIKYKIYAAIAFWGGASLMYYGFIKHEGILIVSGAFGWLITGKLLNKLK